ncbi:collagen-binding protein [Clostridium botulinum]|uniref:Collagen-binding protein n=1 Tax=Clostridium botulinum TaxID=1491 RepID=A0A9Q1UWT3_CLOBO|nr:carboxypeptidase regulatory-like domain-containing protein [Clostridium botulinum]AEB74789.1 Cna protein [Clostridium botulinum BKT015925]KEI01387.1 collagen-binding protein [Clostridium botulinum C/D str. Sp77]KEI02818.1 collagen-binding protein [Clostridium botulinum D str. 16868]KOA72864.1 collagen-binding protein [Clostridium botulinum]KOA82116.1 collagen-binding protein [Clostridium botulinum]
MKQVIQNKYVLGESIQKTLDTTGQEIRLDLKLKQNKHKSLNSEVTGIVKDTNGNPIENATIKVMSSNYEPLMHTSTNSNGIYEFSNIPPNQSYNIFAIAKGKKLEQGNEFTINKGQIINMNFVLKDDSYSNLGVIFGKVINETEQIPVSSAEVKLFASSVEDNNLKAITYTNDNGEYMFTDISKGNYIAKISALGYDNENSDVSITDGDEIVSMVVDITPNGEDNLNGTVSGIVMDGDSVPIDGGDVLLCKVDSKNKTTPIAFTKTNKSGVYLFSNISKGNYNIRANLTELVSTGGNVSCPYFGGFMVSSASTKYKPYTFSVTGAELTNGAKFEINNKFIGNLGGANKGEAIFTVDVDFSINYELEINYLSGDKTRELEIDVNGVNKGSYLLKKTDGWNISDAEDFDVNIKLNSGRNTIRFYNDNGVDAPYIGDIVLQVSPISKSFEPVAGLLSNGAKLSSDMDYIENLGGVNKGKVQYLVITSNTDEYSLDIEYSSPDKARELEIICNNDKSQYMLNKTNKLNYDDDDDDKDDDYNNDDIEFKTIIKLNKGSNNLILTNNNNESAPKIGEIELKEIPVVKKYTVNDVLLGGTAEIQNGFITNMDSKSGYIELKVNAPIDGNYNLISKYVSGIENTTCNIDVNGVSTGINYKFQSTGSWQDDIVNSKIIVLKLQKGENIIKIYNNN